MPIEKQNQSKPWVLVLGATGRTGSKVIAERSHSRRSAGASRERGMKMPAYVEATYGASILKWVRQTYEGRRNFGTVTSVVEDLTGNKLQTLERWVRANREAVLSAAS